MKLLKRILQIFFTRKGAGGSGKSGSGAGGKSTTGGAGITLGPCKICGHIVQSGEYHSHA